jgi:hypothetical protein
MSPIRALPAGLASALLACTLSAQNAFPDMMYFRFNEGTGPGGGTTPNLASPFVGSAMATVTGHTLSAGNGIGGTGALLGATPASSANFVNPGWVTNLGTNSWTISFYADVTVDPGSSLHYAFGDNTTTGGQSAGFRCFYRGVAGTGCMMRGITSDTIIPNAGLGGPHHIAWVYDSATQTLTGYMDGAPAVSSLQTNPLNGTNFRVAGYGTSSWSNGAILDEFRMYSYALTPAEVASTYLAEVEPFNVLAVTQSGPGVGDLAISLTLISPTATEGYMLITFDTSHTVGSGPFFGVYPDAGTWELLITTPLLDSNPIHFPVPSIFGGFPNSTFTAPPGSLSFLTGQSADFAAALFAPALTYAGKSNVVRVSFQ